MTIVKASALTLSLVGAMAFGVWIGPHITQSGVIGAVVPVAHSAQPAATVADSRPTPPPSAVKLVMREPRLPAISPQTPELLERLQPLLNRGADMTLASEGFKDAELFASVAHAARNTSVPFVLLKHRVLGEGKTLDRAIAELQPRVNAAIEATRAKAEGRSDIAALML